MSFLGLEGLHVFITGAAGGIASAAVKEFLGKVQILSKKQHLMAVLSCRESRYSFRPKTGGHLEAVLNARSVVKVVHYARRSDLGSFCRSSISICN